MISLNTDRPAKHIQTQGFTLIEVMIVVAIIAILATIALPGYQDYILRGKLIDATTQLRAKRADLERYFQDNRTYVGFNCVDTTSSKHFDFNCTAAPTDTAYTLRAVGKGGGVSSFTFTVNNAGQETTVAAKSGWLPSGTTLPTAGFCVQKGQPC
jgi:prepilin-type N-terminal cleavage/methylation domain-containing protein